jgi:hypothetical protein
MAAEPTEAKIPFMSESVDLTDPKAVLSIVVALIAGFTLWNMTDDIGQNLASRVNSAIGAVIGVNPSTGESSDGPPGV